MLPGGVSQAHVAQLRAEFNLLDHWKPIFGDYDTEKNKKKYRSPITLTCKRDEECVMPCMDAHRQMVTPTNYWLNTSSWTEEGTVTSWLDELNDTLQALTDLKVSKPVHKQKCKLALSVLRSKPRCINGGKKAMGLRVTGDHPHCSPKLRGKPHVHQRGPAQGWHRDFQDDALQQACAKGQPTFFFLFGVDNEGCSLDVVEGSHVPGFECPQDFEKECENVRCPLGCVAVFDGGILHRGVGYRTVNRRIHGYLSVSGREHEKNAVRLGSKPVPAIQPVPAIESNTVPAVTCTVFDSRFIHSRRPQHDAASRDDAEAARSLLDLTMSKPLTPFQQTMKDLVEIVEDYLIGRHLVKCDWMKCNQAVAVSLLRDQYKENFPTDAPTDHQLSSALRKGCKTTVQYTSGKTRETGKPRSTTPFLVGFFLVPYADTLHVHERAEKASHFPVNSLIRQVQTLEDVLCPTRTIKDVRNSFSPPLYTHYIHGRNSPRATAGPRRPEESDPGGLCQRAGARKGYCVSCATA